MSMQRLYQYLILMRFNKPIGTFLLLWPTLWALWIASQGHPQPLLLCVFIGGVVLMRAAGCVVNDLVDMKFDRLVSRTRGRPLATEQITPLEAKIIFGILSCLAFWLVLLLNRFTILLSVVGLLLAIAYPFMKRYTYWPQLFLGLAFSWGIPMAFAAQTNHIPPLAWLLYGIAMLWAMIYDTQYAMVDREDDLKIGVKSTAILFARHDVWIISLMQLGLISLFLILGWSQSLGTWYYFSVAIGAFLIIYQQNLIRNREPVRCFKAFLNNQWLGLVIFLGIVLG